MDMKNKQVQEAMKKMNVGGAVKELWELKKEIRMVYQNQEQIIPALCSIWDRLLYNTKMLHKIMEHEKLAYDNPPKEHCDMNLGD